MNVYYCKNFYKSPIHAYTAIQLPWKKGTIEVMKVKRNLFRGTGHARLIGFTKQPTHLGFILNTRRACCEGGLKYHLSHVCVRGTAGVAVPLMFRYSNSHIAWNLKYNYTCDRVTVRREIFAEMKFFATFTVGLIPWNLIIATPCVCLRASHVASVRENLLSC